jgi:hypothetical protein
VTRGGADGKCGLACGCLQGRQPTSVGPHRDGDSNPEESERRPARLTLRAFGGIGDAYAVPYLWVDMAERHASLHGSPAARALTDADVV